MGLERSYDSVLKGATGKRLMRYTAGGYIPVDGAEIAPENGKDIITIHTYDLSDSVEPGRTRTLVKNRTLKFKADEFSARFITGPNLPSGDSLDSKIRLILSCK